MQSPFDNNSLTPTETEKRVQRRHHKGRSPTSTPKIVPPINTSHAEFTVRKPRIFTAAPTDYKGNRKATAREPSWGRSWNVNNAARGSFVEEGCEGVVPTPSALPECVLLEHRLLALFGVANRWRRGGNDVHILRFVRWRPDNEEKRDGRLVHKCTLLG